MVDRSGSSSKSSSSSSTGTSSETDADVSRTKEDAEMSCGDQSDSDSSDSSAGSGDDSDSDSEASDSGSKNGSEGSEHGSDGHSEKSEDDGDVGSGHDSDSGSEPRHDSPRFEASYTDVLDVSTHPGGKGEVQSDSDRDLQTHEEQTYSGGEDGIGQSHSDMDGYEKPHSDIDGYEKPHSDMDEDEQTGSDGEQTELMDYAETRDEINSASRRVISPDMMDEDANMEATDMVDAIDLHLHPDNDYDLSNFSDIDDSVRNTGVWSKRERPSHVTAHSEDGEIRSDDSRRRDGFSSADDGSRRRIGVSSARSHPRSGRQNQRSSRSSRPSRSSQKENVGVDHRGPRSPDSLDIRRSRLPDRARQRSVSRSRRGGTPLQERSRSVTRVSDHRPIQKQPRHVNRSNSRDRDRRDTRQGQGHRISRSHRR